jgi:hypothetical protein
MPDIRLLHGIDPVLFILNKWIYYAASEKYTSLVSYIDPNTKKYYNITPRQGLLLLLKNLLYLNKRSSIKLTAIPWAIYLSIFALVLLLLTFLATKIGQRKAKTEMEQLKNFAEKTIEDL